LGQATHWVIGQAAFWELTPTDRAAGRLEIGADTIDLAGLVCHPSPKTPSRDQGKK
jgi:hypothetical protein